MRLLLPNVDKRVYNLQSRQLIKLFARIFAADPSDMMAHLEQGKCPVRLYGCCIISNSPSHREHVYITAVRVQATFPKPYARSSSAG